MTTKVINQGNTRELALKVATEEELQKKTNIHESHEKSIIIVGSKEVGKTTMIYRLLEKEETPKPTLAMDYSYGRKAGKSLVKDIVHVWEIGHLCSSLISSAMSGCALSHSPHHTTIVIMLDLSKPESLWHSLEASLNALRMAMNASYSSELIKEMLEQKKATDLKDKPLERGCDPFPMRLCIIGGKYDEFRELDSEERELIGKTMRAAAHALGASLHYHSAKDSQLLRRTKELLSHYGFKGQPASRPSVTDYEKPLSVLVGNDSFASIGLGLPYDELATNFNSIKQIYVAQFPQKINEESESGFDRLAADTNFQEQLVDRLRLQREQEVSVLLRDLLEAPTINIPIPDPY